MTRFDATTSLAVGCALVALLISVIGLKSFFGGLILILLAVGILGVVTWVILQRQR